MAARLSGQNCKFFKFLLSFNSQKRLRYKENDTKYRSLTRKPRSHVRILICRTWPIASDFQTSGLHICLGNVAQIATKRLSVRLRKSATGNYGLLGMFVRREGYPRRRVTLACIFSFHRVYNAARVIRVGELPYLRVRVTLTGGLTFSLVNTPGRVTLGLSGVTWRGKHDQPGKTTAGYLVF